MTKACDKCRFHHVSSGGSPTDCYAYWYCRHPTSLRRAVPEVNEADKVHSAHPAFDTYQLCERRRGNPSDFCGPDGRQWMNIRWWMFWHWF